MAFDMEFDFRATSIFVTDPAVAVPVINETFPHTYTNGNGLSINAGWDQALGLADRSTTVDARLAGINYSNVGVAHDFKVDLGSGSAPGAGTYTVDLACGDASNAMSVNNWILKDNATTLASGGSTSLGIDQFVDASNTVRSPGTGSWDLVRGTISATFLSTMAIIEINSSNDNARIAHFRLTLMPVSGSGAASPNQWVKSHMAPTVTSYVTQSVLA